ncbi:[FeFe] hydrogenase, NuoF-like subunit [Brevinematales bacterium NS]|nr:[FeFe] hydrogenase, NuoF-like subunit [Brevinematales bacterium NS]
MKVLPDETFYVDVKVEDADRIVQEHLLKGRPVKDLVYQYEESQKNVRIENIPFYQKQFRIVLRNCGVIDPENINEYIARDGYKALEKVLFEMKPDDVIEELKISGLRGRGGAGFPTWRKWVFTKDVQSDVKYVVCNADEGDPGAYMDRSTIEGDPHSIIEAMTICGYTVGANQGYVYIRAEYPLAIKRLEKAIQQAREMGLLGKDILGSGFDFDIEIRLGAGAFVCGEETALLASIEGNRGMPRPRPPFPAVSGLWGKPTVINNVETWASIPVIILKGGKWFASIGTETSKGTKVFALTGKVNNSGLIEVPMGTTLREVIFDIGGGIKGGKKFKAVQSGGPSGGVIPAEYLDTPIDYENLQKLGSIMGSGGLIVMDEDDCMIDIAKFYLEFTVDESCGKCSPCRIGGRQMHGILDRISKGKGELSDIDKLKKIGQAMQKASLCGLGQTAPNPVLSTLRYFEHEYRQHIVEKKCTSGSCKELVSYVIDPQKCIGCGLCAMKCPVNCISGEKRKPHTIDQAKCIKCGNCYTVCKFGAVMKS